MHACGVKPENILIDSDCFIKITDFGVARELREETGAEKEVALSEYVPTRREFVAAAEAKAEKQRQQRLQHRQEGAPVASHCEHLMHSALRLRSNEILKLQQQQREIQQVSAEQEQGDA